jgi:hypothetical protein
MVTNCQNERVIGSNTHRWHCKIKLGFGLSECEKLEVIALSK